MIRTSKHITRYSNKNKIKKLSIFIDEYRRVASELINYLWNNEYVFNVKDEEHIFNIKENKLKFPSMLTSDIVQKANIVSFLSGRALKCCLTQIAGMINSEVEKQMKRLIILNKLKFEGKPRKERKNLIKRLKQNIPQIPYCGNINPELNSICCQYRKIESKEFDGYLRLTSITKDKMDIRIPIKMTRHSRKLSSRGNLKSSFLIKKDEIDFRWDIMTPVKKEEGNIVGADQGLLDILSLSDKQTTPKRDIHGHSLSSILDKMSRKVKGSRGFRKAQDHRENFINWSINQLNFSNIKQVNLERIWNIGYRNATSRMMSHWTNTIIRDKVESRCEELGVQVNHQGSTYRSQRCSSCGIVKKTNRKGKVYLCSCGNIIDADYNAALNHEVKLPEIPYSFRSFKLNVDGFYWLESGIFSLEGRSLQSLF